MQEFLLGLYLGGFLDFSTIDIWDQIILCYEGVSCALQYNGISDLYPLDDSSVPQLQQPKISPDIAKYSLGVKITDLEIQLLGKDQVYKSSHL